ncbi:hypothetical protein GCM10010446_28220 [Streptomyces enissocaesilis]|uniref:Uncharacterized protein n=1 Tax=Streptomyces enissocaesilis TaxID=332589 RepID=A0ABN3X864_9ACTN
MARGTAAVTRRVFVAAPICATSGRRSRLIHRVHLGRGPAEGRRKGFTGPGRTRLLDAAHQPGGPAALVQDNPDTDVSRTMRWLLDARSRKRELSGQDHQRPM